MTFLTPRCQSTATSTLTVPSFLLLLRSPRYLRFYMSSSFYVPFRIAVRARILSPNRIPLLHRLPSCSRRSSRRRHAYSRPSSVRRRLSSDVHLVLARHACPPPSPLSPLARASTPPDSMRELLYRPAHSSQHMRSSWNEHITHSNSIQANHREPPAATSNRSRSRARSNSCRKARPRQQPRQRYVYVYSW
jgi:hypothetical protein